MRRLLIAIPILLFAAGAFAQAPGVELRYTPQVLEPGESVFLQLICTNIGKPEPPKIEATEGVELVLDNPVPQTMMQTSIINGRSTSIETYTYLLRLTAQKVGRWTVGPVLVEAGGTTYQTGAIKVVVQPPTQVAKKPGDSLIYASVTATPESLYLSEVCVARLTIGYRKLVHEGRTIDADMIAATLDVKGSNLSVFTDSVMQRGYTSTERTLVDSQGRRFAYLEYTVERRIRADEEGDLAIGPVFVKVNYPTALRRDVFGQLSVSSSQRETANAEAVTIRVKAPPRKGRPASYAGAIGQFQMRVTATPTRVQQGQPVTLSIAINGEPLAGAAGPNLLAQPELASRFDFQRDELVGDIERNAKVFRRAIFPKQAGEQTIPPIEWSYFDTRQEKYITLSSDPIPIVVDRDGAEDRPSLALPTAPATTEETTLTVVTGGISPNYPAAMLLTDQQFVMGAVEYGALAGTPIAYAALLLIARRRDRLRSDASYARRSRALTRAEGHVRQALKANDRAAQLEGLAQALSAYVADRCALGTGALTPSEVSAALRERGLDAQTVGDVAALLETCEMVRFAPGGTQAIDPAEAAGRIREWMRRIEQATR
jgi:hypothetical protein